MRIREPASVCRVVAVLLAAGLMLTLATTAHALVDPAATLPLAPGIDTRYHPDTSVTNPLFPKFNVYTGASMPANYTLKASLASGFTDNLMWGTMTSQVWQDMDPTGDGRLLFAYQIQNTGNLHALDAVSMRTGNVTGFGSGVQFLDCGILDFGRFVDEDGDGEEEWDDGDVDFDQGDVLSVTHDADSGGTEQFGFSFETEVNRWLKPGETSSWFYFEADTPEWCRGIATVQDGGSSADEIPVLVPKGLGAPIPEPVTLLAVLAGVGAIGRYARRRSRNG